MFDLNVVGIVIGLITFYVGIAYSKKLKDRLQLTLVNESWISLLTFQQTFATFRISYDIPNKTNLLYYKGTLLNNGNVDIDKKIIYKPLQLCFPEDSKILECEIVNHSQAFNITKNLEENKIAFEWELMKPQEFVAFECIIESPSSYTRHKFHQQLFFNQRISGLQTVNQIDGWNVEQLNLGKFIWRHFAPYIGVIFFASILVVLAYIGIKSFIAPNIVIHHEVVHPVDKKPIDLNAISLEKAIISRENSVDTIDIKNLSTAIELRPTIEIINNQYVLAIVPSAAFVALILLLIALIKTDIRSYRKMKLMTNLRKESD